MPSITWRTIDHTYLVDFVLSFGLEASLQISDLSFNVLLDRLHAVVAIGLGRLHLLVHLALGFQKLLNLLVHLFLFDLVL